MFINNYIFNTKYNLSWNLANYILAEWLRNPGKGNDFRELKSQKFPGGACPRIPLQACAFGLRLGNRSGFILDPRPNSLLPPR